MRLALAGAGWIAGVHAIAADGLAGVEVSAVASRTEARAVALATRLSATACDYADLPGETDGVIVCTPPARHARDALQAVAGGAGALVEKPLCTTLADADALVDAASGGACIGYAENLAYAPPVRAALEVARHIGALHHIEVRTVQPRPDWGDFLTAGWGGGVLFDLGVHPVAVALLLAAPARPVAVHATLAGADDHPVDEHAELDIEFDGGLRARVVASWRGEGDAVWDVQAASSEGVVRLDLLPEPRLETGGEEVELPVPPPAAHPLLAQMGYVDQLVDFTGAIAAGRSPMLGAAFGRSVLDLVAAAYASSASGARVGLPFAGPRDRTPHELWTL